MHSPRFEVLILVCIALNTLVQATYHWGMSEGLEDGIVQSDNIFTMVFFTEMVLRIIGAGSISGYLADWSTRFDALIVILSLVSMFTGFGAGFSILRTFRVFRVFQLSRLLRRFRLSFSKPDPSMVVVVVMPLIRFQQLQKVVYACMGSGESMMNVMFIMLLTLLIFSLLGITLTLTLTLTLLLDPKPRQLLTLT